MDIDVEVFRKQLNQIRNTANVCSLEEAVDALKQGAHSTEPRVVVTFDDAYENFYTHAWPVMNELKIPSTLYVPVNFIWGKSDAPISRTRKRPCSWAQLRELLDSKLVSIGSHSSSHVDLRKLDDAALHAELRDSQKVLRDELGIPADDFCYPKSLWSTRAESVVKQYYKTAVIRGGRKMTAGKWNPYRLNRVPVRRDMPTDLEPLLRSSVWLEEFFFSRARLWA